MPLLSTLLDQFYNRVKQSNGVKLPNIIMVTLDPMVDNSQRLNEYMTGFNSAFIALTGSLADLEQLATELYMPFQSSTHVMNDGTIHSSPEHSGNIALINPQGRYAGFFKAPLELAKLNTTYGAIVRRAN